MSIKIAFSLTYHRVAKYYKASTALLPAFCIEPTSMDYLIGRPRRSSNGQRGAREQAGILPDLDKGLSFNRSLD